MRAGRRRALAFLGGAAAAPCLRRAAAQSGLRRIGILTPTPNPGLTDPLISALRERGWASGSNLIIETRFWKGDPQLCEALTRELVGLGVEVIVTNVTATAIAARRVTSKVPIVMQTSGFPVEGGLAESLARPGGNVTGVTVYAGGGAIFGKFVELLRELVPTLQELGVLWGYAPPAYTQAQVAPATDSLRSAARSLGINVRSWQTGREQDLVKALAEAASGRLDAMFATAGILHGTPLHAGRIAALLSKRRVPCLTDFRGGLLSAAAVAAYSPTIDEVATRAATYVDRILRGASPAELPIVQPTKYELTLNLRVARAMGVSIPQSLLLRADSVIE
jgi:putative tryptophan/tyrosine transport system substrate-binding protein